jgi:hypothetical protein
MTHDGGFDAGVIQSSMADGQPLVLPASQEIQATDLRSAIISPPQHVDPRGMQLEGAHVVGDLDLTGIDWPAGLSFKGTKFSGRLILTRARLGELRVTNCELRSIECPGARFNGSVTFDGISNEVKGIINFARASVTGDLNFAVMNVAPGANAAIIGTDIEVSKTLYFGDKFIAIGDNREGGLILLIGARLGRLECGAAHIENRAGASIQADGAEVRQDVVFGPGFYSWSSGEHGGLRLPGAAIGGDLDCRGASLYNSHDSMTGPALEAGRMRVANHVFLSDGFRAMSGSHHGTVHMPGSEIGGILDFHRAIVLNSNFSAIVLDNCITGGTLHVGAGFRAQSKNGPAISAISALIGGGLNAIAGRAQSSNRWSIDLTGAQVRGQLEIQKDVACRTVSQSEIGSSWPDFFDVPDQRSAARVVAGIEQFPEKRETWISLPEREEWRRRVWATTAWESDGAVKLSYCTYVGAPRGVPREVLLDWFTADGDTYDPHAFQQLARNYDSEGDQRNAVATRLAQQREYVNHGIATRRGRIWQRLLGLLVGYGLKPARALYWLGALMIVSVAFCTLTASDNWLVRTAATAPPGSSSEAACSLSEKITYATSLTLPIVTGSADKVCAIRPGGGLLALLATGELGVQVLGWLLASVFVAGIIGIIKPAQ